jgi:AcrR family transcriptional regulator
MTTRDESVTRRASNTGDAADTPGVKDRILRAAVHEFALTGYHLTSLRTIAERSGSNKPMIYYHFHGKEGLYLAAVRLLMEETAEIVREVVEAEAPALVKLRRFAEVYLDAFLRSRPMMGTVLREINSLSAPLYHAISEEYSHLIASQLRRILAGGVEQGEFRRIDIEGCSNGVVNLMHGYVRSRRTPPDHLMRAALSQLMDYYAVGLLSREALAAHLDRGAAEARN